MKINLSEHWPLLSVEDHIAHTVDGSMALCYRVQLPEIYSLGASDYDELYDIWFKLLRDITAPAIMLKQDIFLKQSLDTSFFPSTNYFQRKTKQYFHGRAHMEHHCFLFFIQTKKSVFLNHNIRNPFRKLPAVKEIKAQLTEKQLFVSEIEKAVGYLNTQKYLEVVPLSKEEIHYLTHSYFNAFYTDRYTDAHTTDQHSYQIGQRRLGAYVIKSKQQLADNIQNYVEDKKMSFDQYKFYQSPVEELGLKLPFNHVVNQVFFLEDHHQLKKEIKRKESNFRGARGFSKENEVGSEKLKAYLTTIEEENLKLIGSHFNVIFFGDTEKEFKQHDAALSAVFKNMNIFPYAPAGNNLKNIYNNSFFGHISQMNAANIFRPTLQEATCMMLHTTNYKNDAQGIWFNDRLFNIPVIKDVWDAEKKRINARNFFIVAPTGEGKSFLANHIFRQLYEQDYVLVIFDLGGSYEKLSILLDHIYPGQVGYIRYKDGEPLGTNPFMLGEQGLNLEKQNELIEFVWRIWKRRERNEQEDKEESVSIRKVLVHYYEQQPSDHNFPDFYTFIATNQLSLLEQLGIDPEFFNINNFLHVCSEFISGSYSFLFNEDKLNNSRHYNVEHKRVVVFELDEAKDDPLLLSILLQMGFETVKKIIWKDKSTKGVVYFDEFAKMLEFGTLLASVKYYSQAIRKQTGAIGLALQTPNQLPENSTAKSIIDNTQVYYILKGSNYEDIIDRFKLSEHDRQQLYSITNQFSGKQRYSEFMLKIGNHSNVMRLEVPEELQLAYMTDGTDNAILMDIYKEKGDLIESIKQFKDEKNTRNAIF
ncbi:TraG family conjugative transposon ATPase [Flexithrix dorotheae]|uniref:TraG family conjugative transposon ATPase n=1 Tax=Flexithrix dorotheae TaxID=70993 RepID=UPI00036A4672|nr:TraG family conjugative transposon ATPase [Flexithrix dorotheae]